MEGPRLYNDLVWVWPFVSLPESYIEEVETFRRRFARHGVPDGATVLHLGSGGGSIDYHLKRHYRVTGVDVSPAMIDHARKLNPEVDYYPADIRAVDLGTTFDAVLLHDAASYLTTLDDLLRACRAAARHLDAGGVLVTLPEEIRSRFVQHKTEARTRVRGDVAITTVTVDYDPDPNDTWFETTFLFLIRDREGVRVEMDVHRIGLFHLEDMLCALRAAGFSPAVSPWELSDVTPGADNPIVTAVRTGVASAPKRIGRGPFARLRSVKLRAPKQDTRQ